MALALPVRRQYLVLMGLMLYVVVHRRRVQTPVTRVNMVLILRETIIDATLHQLVQDPQLHRRHPTETCVGLGITVLLRGALLV